MAVMRLGSGLTLLPGSRSEIFLYSAAPTRASCFGPCLTGASAFSSYDFTGVEDVVEVALLLFGPLRAYVLAL